MTCAARYARPGYMLNAVLAPVIISSVTHWSMCGAPPPPCSGEAEMVLSCAS